MTEYSTVLEFFTGLISGAINWCGSVIDFIVGQPLILVPMLVFFIAGGTIGLVNRLIRG